MADDTALAPLPMNSPQLPKPTIETFGASELDDLPARTAEILRMLSGMEARPGGGRWTLQAVGDEFDLSRTRIHALRGEGLKQIREARERQRGLR